MFLFRFSAYCVLTSLLFATVLEANSRNDDNEEFWKALGRQDLKEALKRARNEGVAKNVIIFIGDGMGIPTITAARIYRGQTRGQPGEENYLLFEKFPTTGLIKLDSWRSAELLRTCNVQRPISEGPSFARDLYEINNRVRLVARPYTRGNQLISTNPAKPIFRTYNVDRQVPDSAATATAIFSGVKTNYETLGLSPKAKPKDCNSTFGNEVTTILDWAQKAGKDTGIVTTTRITHATPAALYSKSAHRNWESDDIKPANASRCKDIARQLVENEPGSNVKVILGGGRRHLIDKNQTDGQGNGGQRTDNKQLIKEWLEQKASINAKASYVATKSQLLNANTESLDYLMGIFSANHMDYELDRDNGESGQPSLAEMTEVAIKMLKKSSKGFFLLVEGGRIDHGHHANLAKKALHETIALEDAVGKALSLVNREETLIVVTADHSHVMTINGYPVRGNNILGIADVSDVDHVPYTTIMYTTGPSATNHSYENRTRLRNTNLNDKEYRPLSLVPHVDETHGGEDVALYATGPMAHLFQGVHEQNYIAHVMGYASCVGENKDHCLSGATINSSTLTLIAFVVFTALIRSYL